MHRVSDECGRSAARPAASVVQRRTVGAILDLVESMGTESAAHELGIDGSTVRRRRSSSSARDWSLADVVALACYERDELGATPILDALVDAIGGAPAHQPMRVLDAAAAMTGSAARYIAEASDAASDGQIDRREAGTLIDRLEHLIGQARCLIEDLRAVREASR